MPTASSQDENIQPRSLELPEAGLRRIHSSLCSEAEAIPRRASTCRDDYKAHGQALGREGDLCASLGLLPRPALRRRLHGDVSQYLLILAVGGVTRLSDATAAACTANAV